MIRTLLKEVRQYKAASIATPLFMILEVLMEMVIPFLMASIIDHDKHRVFVDGEDAGLTQNEFKLVSLLGKYAGKVLTYDYMMKEIWGPNMKNDNRILRVNMANIRRKIEKNPAQPEFIFTEIGVGYRFVEADVQAKEKK